MGPYCDEALFYAWKILGLCPLTLVDMLHVTNGSFGGSLFFVWHASLGCLLA